MGLAFNRQLKDDGRNQKSKTQNTTLRSINLIFFFIVYFPFIKVHDKKRVSGILQYVYNSRQLLRQRGGGEKGE